MATWDPPSDAELDVDKPIKAVDIRRIRDLSEAMAEGAAGAPIAGGLIPLATIDLAGEATADFTTFDATKYDSYIFEFMNVVPATDGAVLYVRTSTDGGSTYDSGSDYAFLVETVGISAAVAKSVQASTDHMRLVAVGGIGSAVGEDGYSGTSTVHGPHLAKETQITSMGGYMDNAGDRILAKTLGVRTSSADVDAIRFFMGSGNLESGTITMYGKVGA